MTLGQHLLLVMSMFFMHVVILLKICYVISDKQKHISSAEVVVVETEADSTGVVRSVKLKLGDASVDAQKVS